MKFAFWFYLATLLVRGGIFFLSHIPPQAANFDGAILKLSRVEKALAAPRLLLRALWPGESTPYLLSISLAVLNCLIWGAALTGLAAGWKRLRG